MDSGFKNASGHGSGDIKDPEKKNFKSSDQSWTEHQAGGSPIARNIRLPNHVSEGRLIRWKREHASLQSALNHVMRSNAAIVTCGPDANIERCAKEHGFGRFDLVIVRVLFGKWSFSVICVPTRLWTTPKHMRKLFLMKAAASSSGHRVMLLPASPIMNSQRHANALMLSSARSLKLSRSERQKIMDHVSLNNPSSVEDCAKLVRTHQDPLGAVLHLVAHRWLRLSPGRLGPNSVVSTVST